MTAPAAGGRRTLLIGGAVVFADILLFSALGPILPVLADRFNLSSTATGLLTAGCPIGEFAAALPAAFVCQRFGARRSVLIGVLFTGLASIAFGIGRGGFALMLAARLIQGAGSGLTWVGVLTLGAMVMPAARRGEAIGTIMASAALGAVAGPILGAAASRLGLGATFGSFGVAIVAVGAIFVLRAHEDRASRYLQTSRLVDAVRDPAVQRSLGAVVAMAALGGAITLLAPLSLSDRGMGENAIALVLLLSAGGGIVLNPIAGRHSDRRGPALLLRIMLAATGVSLLALAGVESQIVTGLLIIVANNASGLAMVPATAALSGAAESAGLAPEFGFSMMSLAWAPGFGGGSLAAGATVDAGGFDVAFVATAAVAAFALAALYRRYGVVTAPA